ncbi:MAG: PatB family C-S lyase [Eubacteriales bacterium]|nr:PatB family C-S lyase [Eubacteriales bacterium]
MKYDFDKVWDRTGSDSIKWEKQLKFGVQSGLLPFWIADTDFAVLPEAAQAMKKRIDHPLFGYTFTGNRTLETVRSWYERRHQVKLPVEAYMASGGVVTALWFTIRAFTEPGDKILTFTPVYDPFFAVTKNQGREVAECPLIYENCRYEMDWERLEELLKSGIKAMIFCNPHNPMGKVWSSGDVKRIVELCREYSVLLLSDEVHGDVVFEGKTYTSAARFADLYDQMIVYTAISKPFNMAGLHSSCLIFPNREIRERLDKAMREAWLMGPNAMANCAIEACYTYGEDWLEQMNAYVEANAAFASAYLKEHAPEVDVVEPEGTFLMWLDFARTGLTGSQITDILAKEYGTAVGSGSGYGGNGDTFIRFNIGCPRSVLEKGLENIVQFLKDRRGN